MKLKKVLKSYLSLNLAHQHLLNAEPDRVVHNI